MIQAMGGQVGDRNDSGVGGSHKGKKYSDEENKNQQAGKGHVFKKLIDRVFNSGFKRFNHSAI